MAQVDALFNVLRALTEGPAGPAAPAGLPAGNRILDIQEAMRQPAPDPVEAERLSTAQRILQSLASAGSTFASGINPNVQAQDFLGQLMQMRQEQADRENVQNRQGFEDQQQALLRELQVALGDKQTAIEQARIDEQQQIDFDREQRALRQRNLDQAAERQQRGKERREDREFQIEMFNREVKARDKQRANEKNERFAQESNADFLEVEAAMIGGLDANNNPIPSIHDAIAAAETDQEKFNLIKGMINRLNQTLRRPYMTDTVAGAIRELRDDFAETYADDIESFDFSEPERPTPRTGFLGTINTLNDLRRWMRSYKELEAKLAGNVAAFAQGQ